MSILSPRESSPVSLNRPGGTGGLSEPSADPYGSASDGWNWFQNRPGRQVTPRRRRRFHETAGGAERTED